MDVEKDLREISVRDLEGCDFIEINDRVDAFNYLELMSLVEELTKKRTSWLVFNLQRVKFLSLPSIKLMDSLGRSLKKNGQSVGLLGPSEKLKRQIDIYASLDHVVLFRSEQELHESLDV